MTNATKNKTDLADLLNLHIRARHLPAAVREYRPFPDRRFRLDLSWPDRKICIEVQGGELMLGRHSRAAGMASDCEKHNLLVLAGWRAFIVTGQQVKDGTAIAFLERVFAAQP